MKALDEYFLMVVFTLLLNRVHVLANFMFNLKRNMTVKGSRSKRQRREEINVNVSTVLNPCVFLSIYLFW